MHPLSEEATIASASRKQLLETFGRLVLGLTLVFLVGVIIVGWTGERLVRRRLAAIAARGEPLTFRTEVPAPGEADAMPLYQQALEALRLSPQERRRLKLEYRGRPLPESVLQANPAALDLCRRASRCSRCIYAPDPSLPGLVQDDDGRLQVAGRLLRDEALQEAARGNTEGALSDLRGIVRVSNHAGSLPGTMGLLRRIAFRTLAHQAAGEMLLMPGLAPSTIDQIGQAVPPIDWQQAGVDAVREERAVGLAIYDASIFRSPATAGSPPLLNRGSEIRSFFRWDELAFLDAIDRSVRQVQEPLFRSESSPAAQVAPYAPFARQLTPDGSRLRAILERAIARDREARIAVALATYYHRNGAYPTTLNAVGPGVEIRDPYAEVTFRYRREGKRYRFWSVVPNRRDEGGSHRKPKDDLVWPIPLE